VCPDAGALSSAVSRHLVSSALDPAGPRRVEATVRRDARRFLVTLRLFDEAGTLRGSRSLASETESCAPLFRSVAFAIALAIDPDAHMNPREEPVTPVPPEPTQDEARASPRASEAPQPSVAPSSERPAVSVRLDALSMAAASSVRIMPQTALGISAAGNVTFGLPLEGVANAHFSPGSSSDPTQGGHVRVGTATLTLGVAFPWARTHAFRSELSAGLTGGVLTLDVRDAEAVGASVRPFIAAQAGIGLRALLDEAWGFRAAINALLPLHRYRMRTTGYPGVLWEQPGAGLVAEVGPVWVFAE
jgi:hypothetical protein